MFKRTLRELSFHDSAGNVNKNIRRCTYAAVPSNCESTALLFQLSVASFFKAVLFIKCYFDSLWILKYIYIYIYINTI